MKVNAEKERAVTVTVSTEQEPTSVAGKYRETDGGFVLEFDIGDDKFAVIHTDNATELHATGVMNYDITLSDEPTSTLLATPFGKVKFKVTTAERRVQHAEGGFCVRLGYILHADGVGDMARAVDITAKFD